MDAKDLKKNNYLKSLEQEVARQEADKKALIKEFEKVAGEELTPEHIRQKIREEILPAAWISLKDLIMNAESEAVRSSLIKWSFEFGSRVLPSDVPVQDPDKELTMLLKGLVKPNT